MAIQYYDGVNIVGGFKVGDSLVSSLFEVESGGDILVNTVLKVSDDFELSGAFYDSSNQSGTSGQILSSTSNGTDWIDAPSGGSSPWTTDTNGITYTAGAVGIGMASVSGMDLAVDGFVRLYDGFRVNGNTTMDGTLSVLQNTSLSATSLSGDLSMNGNDILTEGGDILDNTDSAGAINSFLMSKGTGNGVRWIPVNAASFSAVTSVTTGEPSGSDSVINIVSLTQAEYDAGTPVATTLYIIT